MTISDKLLKELVCPKCRGPLEFQKAENRLICRACKLAYAISDDVPVMLIDEGSKWIQTAVESLPVPPPNIG